MESQRMPSSVSKRKQACKSCRQRKRRCDVRHATRPLLNTLLTRFRLIDLRARYARNGVCGANIQSPQLMAQKHVSRNTRPLCSGASPSCPLSTGQTNCRFWTTSSTSGWTCKRRMCRILFLCKLDTRRQLQGLSLCHRVPRIWTS